MPRKGLPGKYIKQAGGNLKKAWALYRRKGGGKKGKPRGGGTKAPAASTNSKPGWGRWVKVARTVDVVTSPAQGALVRRGMTKAAAIETANSYMLGRGTDTINPASNVEDAPRTYGPIGTGLGRDYFRSKLNVYGGISRGKLIDMVIASGPEIMAAGEADPLASPTMWEIFRTQYDRAYIPDQHVWDIKPGTGPGTRFWRSVLLDGILKGIQRIFFNTTGPIRINSMLPKGWNA